MQTGIRRNIPQSALRLRRCENASDVIENELLRFQIVEGSSDRVSAAFFLSTWEIPMRGAVGRDTLILPSAFKTVVKKAGLLKP